MQEVTQKDAELLASAGAIIGAVIYQDFAGGMYLIGFRVISTPDLQFLMTARGKPAEFKSADAAINRARQVFERLHRNEMPDITLRIR